MCVHTTRLIIDEIMLNDKDTIILYILYYYNCVFNDRKKKKL